MKTASYLCRGLNICSLLFIELCIFDFIAIGVRGFEEGANTTNNTTEGYEVGCMGIRDIENGNYTILEQNNQLELRISCISGYKLLGDSKIICSDGELPSRLKPQCVRVGCGEPALLPNGELRVEGFKEGQFYQEGVIVEYTCIQDYRLEPVVHQRKCLKGRWSGQNPVCKPNGCRKPKLLLNGHFVPDPDVSRLPVDTLVHFSCNIGFRIQGMETAQCLSSGEWSYPQPQCLRLAQEEGMSCVAPPLGPHVVVNIVRGLQSANSALSGTTLEATCDPGYRDQDSPCVPSMLHCIDGNWQGRFVNCVTVDSCMHPLNLPHATVLRVGLQSKSYALGSQVAYSCHSDYQLVGDAVFTCLTDGCWDPEILPVCHPRHPSHFYMNGGAWSDYIKLNTSMMVSMITFICITVILLSVCLVLTCRPNPSPAPLAQPPADPDRVALIAFADGVQSVLPSYEEAVRGGGVLNCRLHRPHWTAMLGGQRRNNNRQTSSVRDSMGSTDTVTVSEVSTNVTVDTVSSHSGSQTASCHAICGSLASFDTGSVINTDGVPLLEVNELEEVTTNTANNGSAHDPDFKLQSDIASIHS